MGSGVEKKPPGNTKSAKEETQKAQFKQAISCAFCVNFALFVFPIALVSGRFAGFLSMRRGRVKEFQPERRPLRLR
jgi:hypothetical protein